MQTSVVNTGNLRFVSDIFLIKQQALRNYFVTVFLAFFSMPSAIAFKGNVGLFSIF